MSKDELNRAFEDAEPPSTLRGFIDAVTSGVGELINGVRLVYPMHNRARGSFNPMGSKFFSALFSWLLGPPTKDTSCATKVSWRKDGEMLVRERARTRDEHQSRERWWLPMNIAAVAARRLKWI